MSGISRVSNSVKNVGIGTILQLFSLLLAFVTRAIFVKLLGIEYLSVDGLFANILTLLNFAELGIGSAIIYSLYKPIANSDYPKIGALLNLYRIAYRYIAITILGLGILFIPFLDNIISDVPNVKENLTLLYCLFLTNSVCTYIYGYKKSLLTADQKNYIVLLIYQCIHTFQILTQIIILIITQNYILFLLTMIICTLLNNVLTTCYVNRKYTWVREYINQKLETGEKDNIFENIKSIFLYKLGSVILNGTNNIVISTVIKTTLVGFCANYMLIMNSISTVITQGFSGMLASIGNYNVNASSTDSESIFRELDFIAFWGIGCVSVALCLFINDFINIWLGNSFILEDKFVWMLILSFYVLMINLVPSSFRTSLGLFHKAKYYPFIAAIINLVLSILFANWLGLFGIYLANIIARFLCYTLVDTNLIYKNRFEMSSLKYYLTYIGRLIFMILIYLFFIQIFSLIEYDGWQSFILKVVLFFILYNVLFVSIFWKSNTFGMLKNRISLYIKKK